MTPSNYKIERVAFGLILCIALLMSFQPIVRLHGPNGSQVSNAFNVRAGLTQLQSTLRLVGTITSSPDSDASLVSLTGTPATPKPLAMPFSLRMAPQVQWLVFAALAFCLLALGDLLFFQKAAAMLSFAGGCFAAVAVLHVTLMGSDLQSWTEMLTSIASLHYLRDPGLAGRMLMANSFLVSPGLGLYALTTCLFSVPALSSTRAVPRFRSVLRRDPRMSLSQPIFIRPVNSKYPAETCTSLDLSRSGLRLESSLNHHYVGMEVYLTRNVREGRPANPEEHGSVVRVEKMENGKCRIAIRIIPEAS
jgi:hypothetical protein